ncbi:hypothetical protein GGX14DRAFT_563553 [Mycena pura]|uniref:Uncharacterized protein n=1 Tax=Mycena pura TaxID=153505 RepID=A0AAD6VMI2_9AGAR|nr:hypothetical protein GGX14DRAFT_563553 [Mycena pura]
MHESPVSQLLSSLFLASICLIPDHTIRLAALAVSLVMALVYIIYAKYPSTQLAQLEAIIEKTEQVIQDAGAHSSRKLSDHGEGFCSKQVQSSVWEALIRPVNAIKIAASAFLSPFADPPGSASVPTAAKVLTKSGIDILSSSQPLAARLTRWFRVTSSLDVPSQVFVNNSWRINSPETAFL